MRNIYEKISNNVVLKLIKKKFLTFLFLKNLKWYFPLKSLNDGIKSSEEAIDILQRNVIDAKQEKLLRDTRTKLEGLW